MNKNFIRVLLVMVLMPFIQVNALTVSGEYSYDKAYEITNMVNEEREKEGLDYLVLDSDLTNIAMLRAREISVYYDHTRPNGDDCFSAFNGVSYSILGENIAAGYTSVTSVMEGWMNSDSHRKNILSGDYKAIGVGSFTMNGVSYWVQVFSDYVGSEFSLTGSYSGTYDVDVTRDYVGDITIENFDSLDISVDIHDTLYAGVVTFSNKEFSYGEIRLSNEEVEWNSSNENVFKVLSDGTIQPVGIGDASLVVSYVGYEKVFHVHVTGEVVNDITDIDVEEDVIHVNEGESASIHASVIPSDTNLDQTISYHVNDEDIAVVDEEGLVTGISEGETFVTLSTSNGISKDVSIFVHKVVKDIYVSEEEISMDIHTDVTIEAYSVPNESELVWSSDNEDIAIVSDGGVITSNGIGRTVIHVCAFGFDICKDISVRVMNKIIISNQEEEIKTGDAIRLDVRMLSDVDGVTFRFVSSNDSIAVVDENGVVKGISTGRVKIRIIASSGEVISFPLMVMYHEPDVLVPPIVRPVPYEVPDDYGNGKGGDIPMVKRVVVRRDPTPVVTNNHDTIVETNPNTESTIATNDIKKEEEVKQDNDTVLSSGDTTKKPSEKKEVKLPGNVSMRLDSLIGYGIIGVIIAIGIVIFMKIKRNF